MTKTANERGHPPEIRYHVTPAAEAILREGFKPKKGKGVGGVSNEKSYVYTTKDRKYAEDLAQHMTELDRIRTSKDPLEEAAKYAGRGVANYALQNMAPIYERNEGRPLTDAEKAMVVAIHGKGGGKFPEMLPTSFFRDDPARTFGVVAVDVSDGKKVGESELFGGEEMWELTSVRPTREGMEKAKKAHMHAFVTTARNPIFIPLNRLDTPYQTERALDESKIRENVRRMKNREPLEPVVIGYGSGDTAEERDGSRADVLDGHHRLEAAKRIGYTHVPCVVRGNNETRVKAADRRYREVWTPIDADSLGKSHHYIGDSRAAEMLYKDILDGFSPTEAWHRIEKHIDLDSGEVLNFVARLQKLAGSKWKECLCKDAREYLDNNVDEEDRMFSKAPN